MGLSFRKSIKLGKHTKLNISKSGVSVSTGVKGARISAGNRGVNLTLSKNGIRYTKKLK